MKIAIVSDHTYPPQRVGGRESSIHALASLYQKLGHDVMVVTRTHGGRATVLRDWLRHALTGDLWVPPAYSIIRTGESLESVVERLGKPRTLDVAMLNIDGHDLPEVGRSAKRRVIFLRDLQGIASVTPQSFEAGTLLVANSGRVAALYAAATGRQIPVVPPLVESGDYITRGQGQFVTFINPTPKKGVDLACAVAALLPHIPFLFVECWPLGATEEIQLRQRLAGLSNVRLLKRRLNPRSVYRETRVLLVPSQWEEGFGRVVVEAQASGIPCVASHRGGLPEAVCDGGVLLDHDAPATIWARAVERIWHDGSNRTEVCKAARRASRRHQERALRASEQLLAHLETEVQEAGQTDGPRP